MFRGKLAKKKMDGVKETRSIDKEDKPRLGFCRLTGKEFSRSKISKILVLSNLKKKKEISF